MQNPKGPPPAIGEREADYQAFMPASRRSHELACATDAASTPGSPGGAGGRGQVDEGGTTTPISVVVAGLGGQGVLRAAQILAGAAFLAGCDVKTSEVHGMSQRGGSVYSDVRFGRRVYSPMVPAGEADYFLALSSDQVEPHRWLLGESTLVITPEQIDLARLDNRRSLNIALIGALSPCLPIDERHFVQAIRDGFSPDRCDPNLDAFALGRRSREGAARKGTSHG